MYTKGAHGLGYYSSASQPCAVAQAQTTTAGNPDIAESLRRASDEYFITAAALARDRNATTISAAQIASLTYNRLAGHVKATAKVAAKQRRKAANASHLPGSSSSSSSSSTTATAAAAVHPADEDEENDDYDDVNTNTFSKYDHHKIKGCVPHPDPLIESASFALITPPAITYTTHKIMQDVMREGKLSSPQMETVLFACQKHEMFLDSGERRGFFLGDGAGDGLSLPLSAVHLCYLLLTISTPILPSVGVGKGRQLSGIILENWGRGRTKHIWLSASADLQHDAMRDLADVGSNPFSCRETRIVDIYILYIHIYNIHINIYNIPLLLSILEIPPCFYLSLA